jgi:homospermidine synthase
MFFLFSVSFFPSPPHKSKNWTVEKKEEERVSREGLIWGKHRRKRRKKKKKKEKEEIKKKKV